MRVGETCKDGRKYAKYDGYRDRRIAVVVAYECHIGRREGKTDLL